MPKRNQKAANEESASLEPAADTPIKPARPAKKPKSMGLTAAKPTAKTAGRTPIPAKNPAGPPAKSERPARPARVAPEPATGQPDDESTAQPSAPVVWRRGPRWLRVGGGAVLVVLLVITSFELVYAGKIFPGVSADGVYLGGLSQADAATRLADKAATYNGQVVTIASGNTYLRIPVNGLNLTYDTHRIAAVAAAFGRQGSLASQLHQQLRALAGRSSNFSDYAYDDSRLTPYLLQFDDLVTVPAADATLSFDGGRAEVNPATSGVRLDLGRLTQMVNDRLSQTSIATVNAPVYQLAPVLGTAPLQAAVGQISRDVSGPITLTMNGATQTLDQNTIISWITASATPPQPFLQSLDLHDLYPAAPAAKLGLNSAAVSAYVAALAAQTDRPAQNAALAMQNGQLSVAQASQDGAKLDQAGAIRAITAALDKTGSDRQATLSLQTAAAAVNETNLPSLGITGLISEGETYFPGSPADRLINVRAGAAKFNDVLLSPGEEFSFGKLLGEVDASTGYVPELVIDGNHEDYQYGGGLCQVSTTAFRAALAAGLPINERVNHSFAISYYTWPYGVPGVDATIYYPEVDFKFTNDTGHYILIQTAMSGVDLKFDFFGTKAKQGVVRGPYFVSGSNDAKQASKTVFYRDVEDLSGNVIKTDTFTTSYQPSTNFPIVKTFN